MKLSLKFSPELPEIIRRELEQLVLSLQNVLNTSTSSSASSADLAALTATVTALSATVSALSTLVNNHHTRHESGGADAIKLDDLAAPDDNTDLNVTSTKHGLAPKSPADATKFLNGAATPAYAQVKDTDLSVSDNTTNNVSSSAHGFAPKSPADATKFLNGAATPAFALVKDSDLSTSDITTNDVSTSKHGFAPKAPNDTTKFLRGDASYAVPYHVPIIGGLTTVGKRVAWAQKGNGANDSTMQAVGMGAPTITGGVGTFDSDGFWATPQSAGAGGTCRFSAASTLARVNNLPRAIFHLRTPATITNFRILVSLNESLAGVNSDTPSTVNQRGIYVRYSTAAGDGGWVCQTVDGAGRTTSGTILAIAASTIYTITITVNSTTSVDVDINGTTVNVTANIITGVNLGPEVLATNSTVATSFDLESVYMDMR